VPYKTKNSRLVNEVTLGDGYPLSSNLKPLKVGGETSPLEIASAYPDDSVKGKVKVVGDLEVTGSIKGIKEFRHIINGGFNYGSVGGTKTYLPLTGYIFERTSHFSSNEYLSYVTPYDGYLNQVIARSEEACGSTIVGLHKSPTGTEVPNSTASATVTVDMDTDDTPYKFAFSNDNTFSAGEIINISFTPSNDANDTVFTVEFILDSSLGL
jgi:hypothetical protein